MQFKCVFLLAYWIIINYKGDNNICFIFYIESLLFNFILMENIIYNGF